MHYLYFIQIRVNLIYFIPTTYTPCSKTKTKQNKTKQNPKKTTKIKSNLSCRTSAAEA